MFKIKICGITSPEDALLAAEAGADAIGLNFYEQSPRYVTPERAKKIVNSLSPLQIKLAMGQPGGWNGWIFGVYVNPTFDTARQIAAICGAANWQLHGDEPASLIAGLSRIATLVDDHGKAYPRFLEQRHDPSSGLARAFATIRAFRCRDGSLKLIDKYLNECQQAGALPQAVLLDAYEPGSYGGTGQVVDWNVVRNERDLLMGLPVILAGGLTPENVAEAIATARPDAVDVASGVESSPGKKDPDKVRQFIAEARRAFAELEKPRAST
ncbi:MAG: phosphoribosylanthranilate isomerase [Pirellulaceae bacterium]